MGLASGNPEVNYSNHLDGRLEIFSARGDLMADVRAHQPIDDGLKLVVSNVEMLLRANYAEPLVVRQPTVLTILSDGEHERDQTAYAGLRRWDVALTLDRSLVQQEFGRSPEEILKQQDRRPLVVNSMPADAAVKAMVMQLLTMPNSNSGRMLRMATGLNLAATVLENISAGSHRTNPWLKPVDLERIKHAQDLLRQEFATAPDMRELARRCGTNPAKFNRDFRTVTGQSPNAWLQEQKLTSAWRMLANKSCSVAEAAHAVGYTPSHFSTLFSRRFNVTPGSLVRGNAD